MVKGMVFDMDGTLFDSEQIVQKAWDATGEELGIEQMGNHIYNTIGFNYDRRGKYFAEHISPDFPIEQFSQRARENFVRIAAVEGIALKPGAHEILTYARGQGLKIALATSSSEAYSVELLKSGGIYEFFDTCVYGDMVKNAKPDPEIYLRACHQISEEPVNCIAFEDSPAGVQSAYGAGLKVIMVPDLVKPAMELKQMTYAVCDSLQDAMTLLKS